MNIKISIDVLYPMQLRLLDILADPDQPDVWPLKLKIFKSEERERENLPHPHQSTGLLCKFYCYTNKSYLVSDPLGDDEKTLSKDELDKVTDLDGCYTCIKQEVLDGVLYHEQDEKLKFFVIDREIPVMYPLELRDSSIEQNFINRYEQECKEMSINAPYSA